MPGPYAIAVDVGGTFTDLCLVDGDGTRVVVKVPSVPDDPSLGVIEAVDHVAARIGIEVGSLLGECERFVHGSTVATNAILERDLATVGLLTTDGFRDSLEIRRGIREDQWDHRAEWPPPVVPRFRRIGVGGRIDAAGAELQPLDLDGVAKAAELLAGVDAVAICLIHSYANPIHEVAAAEILREFWPGDLTSVSSELVPLLGEYERTSTTVLNAALYPRVGGYLNRLAAMLAAKGLTSTVLMLQSNGGTVPLTAAASRPVDLVLSGPAAVVGALNGCREEHGDDFVSMEIGGTSCDVAVMAGGLVPVTDGLVVGGYHLAVPAVDVHTVGAGGGTIASVDDSGLLHVGPKGAGAIPGPACYQRGGTKPAATDAHLVLGRLRPGPYADGSVVLDLDCAEQAIRLKVAEPLGLDVETAAQGILAVLEQNLRQAVETITIERGRDPGQMVLVAAGGAGGFHGSAVARALGCRALLIPAEAGVFCAIGMIDSDLRLDRTQSISGVLEDIGIDTIRTEADTQTGVLEERAHEIWPVGVTKRTSSTFCELRYPGQLWSVRVPVSDDPRSAFEAEYARLYGHFQPDGELQVTAVGATLVGHLDPTIRHPLPEAQGAPEATATRRCWVSAAAGWVETPVYQGASLRPGHTIDGPYIIEAETTTVLGLPGDRLTVSPIGDFEVELR